MAITEQLSASEQRQLARATLDRSRCDALEQQLGHLSNGVLCEDEKRLEQSMFELRREFQLQLQLVNEKVAERQVAQSLAEARQLKFEDRLCSLAQAFTERCSAEECETAARVSESCVVTAARTKSLATAQSEADKWQARCAQLEEQLARCEHEIEALWAHVPGPSERTAAIATEPVLEPKEHRRRLSLLEAQKLDKQMGTHQQAWREEKGHSWHAESCGSISHAGSEGSSAETRRAEPSPRLESGGEGGDSKGTCAASQTGMRATQGGAKHGTHYAACRRQRGNCNGGSQFETRMVVDDFALLGDDGKLYRGSTKSPVVTPVPPCAMSGSVTLQAPMSPQYLPVRASVPLREPSCSTWQRPTSAGSWRTAPSRGYNPAAAVAPMRAANGRSASRPASAGPRQAQMAHARGARGASGLLS